MKKRRVGAVVTGWGFSADQSAQASGLRRGDLGLDAALWTGQTLPVA